LQLGLILLLTEISFVVVLGEVCPAATDGGVGGVGDECSLIGLPGEAGDDLGGRVVDFPLESGLNKAKGTCLTDIFSKKMDRRKLKRRGREILDSFLLRR